MSPREASADHQEPDDENGCLVLGAESGRGADDEDEEEHWLGAS
jgi:hypothetical protein